MCMIEHHSCIRKQFFICKELTIVILNEIPMTKKKHISHILTWKKLYSKADIIETEN